MTNKPKSQKVSKRRRDPDDDQPLLPLLGQFNHHFHVFVLLGLGHPWHPRKSVNVAPSLSSGRDIPCYIGNNSWIENRLILLSPESGNLWNIYWMCELLTGNELELYYGGSNTCEYQEVLSAAYQNATRVGWVPFGPSPYGLIVCATNTYSAGFWLKGSRTLLSGAWIIWGFYNH